MVRITSKRDVEVILQADEALHSRWRGRVHTDAAVPVDAHEAERWIDFLTHDREVELVALGDRPPEVHPRAAERIHSHAYLRATNGVHVDHVAQIADIGVQVVMSMGRGTSQSFLVRDTLDLPELLFE